jgi:hypothetical protein
MNQMKQIMLAAHNYASLRGEQLPSPFPSASDEGSFFIAIFPHVEQAQKILVGEKNLGPITVQVYDVLLYQCPADPSIDYYPCATAEKMSLAAGNCSYAANMAALAGAPYLDRAFPDGTANTIALAEHYARCGSRADYVFEMVGLGYDIPAGTVSPGPRRATFADRQNLDVFPVTSGQPPVTVPSTAGKTFQTGARPPDCDAAIPQSPHLGGMVTALVDGSVRVIAPTIPTTSFWGAVTPAAGEVPGSDW